MGLFPHSWSSALCPGPLCLSHTLLPRIRSVLWSGRTATSCPAQPRVKVTPIPGLSYQDVCGMWFFAGVVMIVPPEQATWALRVKVSGLPYFILHQAGVLGVRNRKRTAILKRREEFSGEKYLIRKIT